MKRFGDSVLYVATLWAFAANPRGTLGLLRQQLPESSSSCDWATFGEGVFNRTSVHAASESDSQKISFAEYHEPNEWLGMFVHPEYNFAFCPIQKNGCTAWTTTLNRMLTGNLSASYYWRVANLSQEMFGGIAAIEKVFRNSHATRAVFVRDPLVRFASAYLNKCVLDERGRMQGHCPLADGEYRFSRAVEYFLQQDMGTVNAHWSLQAYHCELHKRVKQFTVIGFMEKDKLASDATCLLKAAGLERFNAFEDESDGNHEVNPSMEGMTEVEVLKNLFTPAAARAMIDHLIVDYDTFGFNKNPDWIADATGRWFDTVPYELTAAKEMESGLPHIFYRGAPRHRTMDMDEDDIVDLATRLGFV